MMEVSLSLIASRHNQNEQLIKYNRSPLPTLGLLLMVLGGRANADIVPVLRKRHASSMYIGCIV